MTRAWLVAREEWESVFRSLNIPDGDVVAVPDHDLDQHNDCHDYHSLS